MVLELSHLLIGKLVISGNIGCGAMAPLEHVVAVSVIDGRTATCSSCWATSGVNIGLRSLTTVWTSCSAWSILIVPGWLATTLLLRVLVREDGRHYVVLGEVIIACTRCGSSYLRLLR